MTEDLSVNDREFVIESR